VTRQQVEQEQALLRLKATALDLHAAQLRLGAAAARGAAAFMGLSLAVAEMHDAEEVELLYMHPDLMELDLSAAWNPERQ
jgi:hypothetical protein